MRDKIETALCAFIAASVITAPIILGTHVLIYFINIISL